ncbi:hypothetical protein DFJ77DRAFT_15756 [Powellomyces hirtus]|nr:hypothetical protein DFJ77DRAFT_15756 [Powellomyces hirtus]
MPVQPPPSDNNPHRRHYSSGSSSSPSARPILAHVAQAAAARSAIKEEQQHWANINKSNTDLGSSSSDIARARKNSLTPSAPGLSMSASGMAQEEAAWKVIGRRSSTSVPAISDTQQDENNRTEQYPQMHDESDDPALSHQRAFRARAASTPNPLMVAENKSSSADYPPGLGPTEPEQSGAGSGTWNGPGMAWGASQSSIWKGTTSASAGSTPIDNNKTAYFPSDIASTTASFPSRQYRSFSFSLGSMRGLEPYEEEGGESFDRDRVTTLPLRGGDDNDDDEPYDPTAIPKMRSRSKSSSEIYGLLSGQESRYTYPPDRSASPVSPPGAGDYGDVNSIWAATQGTAAGRAHDAATAMMHRRPSAQAGVHWESMRGNGQGNDNGMGGPSADQLDRYRQQRRFSHAPGLYNDFSQQMMSR